MPKSILGFRFHGGERQGWWYLQRRGRDWMVAKLLLGGLVEVTPYEAMYAGDRIGLWKVTWQKKAMRKTSSV